MARNGYKDEKRLSLLFSTCFNKIIWAVKANDATVSLDKKLEIARTVLIKMLPADIKGENIGNTIINLIRNDRAVREDEEASLLSRQVSSKQV